MLPAALVLPYARAKVANFGAPDPQAQPRRFPAYDAAAYAQYYAQQGYQQAYQQPAAQHAYQQPAAQQGYEYPPQQQWPPQR